MGHGGADEQGGTPDRGPGPDFIHNPVRVGCGIDRSGGQDSDTGGPSSDAGHSPCNDPLCPLSPPGSEDPTRPAR